MAGSFTPDCLSRESSPIPEAGMETEVSHSSSQPGNFQGQQQHTHPAIAELRFSQSAPGSPSGNNSFAIVLGVLFSGSLINSVRIYLKICF